MGQIQIWRGLEREVRAQGSRVLFERARARHEALQPYVDLPAAVEAAASCRCECRDAIVAALVAERRSCPSPAWSAAAILAMGPPLMSLARSLKSAPGERNDAKSIVLAAFLEAVNHISNPDRIGLRLYSETRRRVFHRRGTSIEDHGRRCSKNVAACASDEVSVETLLDHVSFVRRATAASPEPGERPVTYAERVAPSPTRRDRQLRSTLLSNHRSASLADLRDAFRSICQPQTDGETR